MSFIKVDQTRFEQAHQIMVHVLEHEVKRTLWNNTLLSTKIKFQNRLITYTATTPRPARPTPCPVHTMPGPHHVRSTPRPTPTTSGPHHAPSAPRPVHTTPGPHHARSTPCPAPTTSGPHHAPSTPRPAPTTSGPHHAYFKLASKLRLSGANLLYYLRGSNRLTCLRPEMIKRKRCLLLNRA